ncbi:MAG: hypothetical protein ACKOCB_09415 [Planctomycetia bacterium]
MRRATSYVLLVLVALMALVPQALCPCARSVQAQQPATRLPGPAAHAAPACPHCARAALALAREGSDTGRRAPACPCCEINGKGKLLLEVGESVRPAPLAMVAPLACHARALDAIEGVLSVPGAWQGPAPPQAHAPDGLRHGVVLRI